LHIGCAEPFQEISDLLNQIHSQTLCCRTLMAEAERKSFRHPER
jgi:hypothetical protein